MKKIIIAISVLCSLSVFAAEITGPRHRVEGNVGGDMQIEKEKEKSIQVWQRYTNLGASYIPEWKYEINEKLALVFGPKATFSVKTSVIPNKNNSEEDWYGLEGKIGGELNLDFKLPEGEVIFLGFDATAGGIGYLEKISPKYHGVSVSTGITLGGKLSDKIKLGARVGYDYEGLWNATEKANKRTDAHSLALGITFGYLFGE